MNGRIMGALALSGVLLLGGRTYGDFPEGAECKENFEEQVLTQEDSFLSWEEAGESLSPFGEESLWEVEGSVSSENGQGEGSEPESLQDLVDMEGTFQLEGPKEEEELSGFSSLPAEEPLSSPFGEGEDWPELFSAQASREEGGEDSNVSADEEGWEISLVYFDSQVDEGQTAIYPDAPLVWHATGTDKEREITLQIQYSNTQMERSYGPGEVKIEIPDLPYLVSGGRLTSEQVHGAVIGADSQAEGTQDYLFWYTYDTDSDTGNKTLVFRNKETLEEKNNFEGSIQITYTLRACAMDTDKDWTLAACLNDSLTSNPFKLEFDSTPAAYQLTKEGKIVDSLEGLPSGDYIWAYFKFEANSQKETGIRYLDPDKSYCLETLPENCLVYDFEKNEISKGEDGKYRIPLEEREPDYERQILWGICYVGFPRSIYGTYAFINEVELYGAYHSQDALNGEGGSAQYLARATLPVSVADFDFNYSGNLYSLHKEITSKGVSSIPIRKSYEGVWFALTGQWNYTSGTMKVEIGDDAMGLLYDTGEFKLLNEGDYYFTQITVPKAKGQNGVDLAANKVTYTLYTRREGESSFDSTVIRSRRTLTFSQEDKVVEWYVTLGGLKETIMMTDTNAITACVCVHDENMTPRGELFNLSYLQVYLNEVAQINPGIESYGNDFTRDTIASHDLGRYGEYRYRASDGVEVKPFSSGYRLNLSFQDTVNNPSLNRFDLAFVADAVQVKQNGNSVVDAFQGYSLYFLLPLGYELTGDYTLTGDPEGTLWSRIRKSDGSSFSSQQDYTDYLSQHLTLSIQENYRGTGRTLAKAIFDFSQEPLDMTGIASLMDYTKGTEMPDVRIQMEGFVTYDNYLDEGSNYRLEGLIMETGVDNITHKLFPEIELYMPHEDTGFGIPANLVPNTQDVDEDGVVDELVGYYGVTQIITDAVSTHKDISVLVQSESQNFNTSYAQTTPGGSYTYKLRIRNAQEQVTNVVLYDPLEQAGLEGELFQGTLTGVDTSYATGQGYRVEVYASTKETPSLLGEGEGEWTLLENIGDYSQIKVLAYQFLNQDGTAAVLPASANLYVLAHMKAPEEGEAGAKACNQIYVTWVATDSLGVPLSGETTLTSNTVEVRMTEPVAEEYVLTLEKRILKSEVNFTQGYPTFFLCVTGVDTKGREVSLERVVQFQPSDEEMEGFLRKSVTFPLKAGTYRAREEKTMRYQIASIEEVSGGNLEGEEAVFTLGKNSPSGSAVFVNEKTREMGLSDTALVVNTIG